MDELVLKRKAFDQIVLYQILKFSKIASKPNPLLGIETESF